MAEETQISLESDADWLRQWGAELVLTNCEACDSTYMLPSEHQERPCPLCGSQTLTTLEPSLNRPAYTQSPEMVVPFTLSEERLTQSVTQFSKGIWLAPADLNASALIRRLQPVYLPMWLVDADVQAQWQAEVGFDYEIVSHRERFNNGQWQTQQIKETKVRWEPRVGLLNRHYDNQSAPALEEQRQIMQQLGWYRLEDAKRYHSGDLAGAVVRLPNRSPDDAWPEAETTLKATAAAECQKAAAANHLRDYRWSAKYQNQNWTQLLLPLYSTYFLDDDQQAQMVFVHGQTGKLYGSRRASMKKARRYALYVLIATTVAFALSLISFLIGLGIDNATLMSAGGAGFTLSVFLGATAVLPVALAWYTNHAQAINAAQQFVREMVIVGQQRQAGSDT